MAFHRSLVFSLCWLVVNSSTLRLPKWYSDGVVFQSAPTNPIFFGFTDDLAEPIIVRQTCYRKVLGESRSMADPASGIWTAKLNGQPNGVECLVEASQGEAEFRSVSIVFGDVIVCSGQSNMEFPMKQMFESDKAIQRGSNMSNIRMFQVLHATEKKPINDLTQPDVNSQWKSPSDIDSLKSYSAVCFMYAMHLTTRILNDKAHIIGLIQSTWGGTRIEAWSSSEALAHCPVADYTYQPNPVYSNSELWNAMLSPLTRHDLRHWLWYQGEANDHWNRDLYNCTFPAMIADWRRKWRSSGLPFGFVQLANNVGQGSEILRWHQTVDKGFVPNSPYMEKTFMAVAMDTFDQVGGLHPRYKQIVAKRLATVSARVVFTKQSYPDSGPKVARIERQNETILITLNRPVQYNSSAEFNGFYFCLQRHFSTCDVAPNSWQRLDSSNVAQKNRETMQLVIPASLHPSGLAYMWEDSPIKEYLKAPIYSLDRFRLPLPPFKSAIKQS